MRFGVVGLGSMGQRRVRDLLALGHEVVGCDARPDRNERARARFGIETASDWEAIRRAKPEAMVVAVPPDQHVAWYARCFEVGLPFFSEANILTPTVEWFVEREAGSGVRGYPSATWRFHSLLAELREQVQGIGLDQVRSVHCRYGGYLPSWHPWESYAEFYAGSRRQTCAAREMVPFELEWLCWVFGPVRAVCALHDRRAEWITEIDDTYLLLLEFESGLKGTLSVELHQVAPFRISRVSCRRHSFLLDLQAHELKRFDLEQDRWQTRSAAPFDFEQVYLAEITAFVNALTRTAPYPKTWAEDRHLSSVLVAAEESWRRRAWVDIKEADGLYDGLQPI